MTPSQLGMPASLPAGDTWTWDLTVPPGQNPDGSARSYAHTDGWALALVLVGRAADGQKLQLAGAGVAGSPQVYRITAAVDKTQLPPGAYRYQVQLSKAGERYTVETGQLAILADVSAAVPGGDLSPAELELAAIRAALLSVAKDGVVSYTVGTHSGARSVTLGYADAIRRENLLIGRVNQERRRKRGLFGTDIRFQFGPPR